MSLDKKYQVFVSSTFEDLVPEREAVFSALMKGNFIPAGMEVWTADTRPAIAVIEAEIDLSDYYVIVIGGRYGSVDKAGTSYTELEYNYALKKGLPILAFLHGAPGEIPAKHTESSAKNRKKLVALRKRLKEHTIGKWRKPEDLGNEMLAALQRATARSVAKGWVRADRLASVDALEELVRLQRENSLLRAAISEDVSLVPDIAELDETYHVHGTYGVPDGPPKSWGKDYTWAQLFVLIASHLQVNPSMEMLRSGLVTKLLRDTTGLNYGPAVLRADLADGVWGQIRTQFLALKLIRQVFRDETEWQLTPQGEELYVASQAIRTKKKQKKADEVAS